MVLAERSAARLEAAAWDVLVIGGGIVGAGVARDAALRGLRTALVEQSDFASGTSSRSSRLLHGGIRYLAQGRIGLVREASREKRVLHRIAPHLAEPLAFIFPTRRGTPWAWWKLGVGVKLYDLLCGGRNLGKSSVLGVAGVEELLPGLNRRNLTGAVRYFDGLTNDARLVVDTLRSAAAHGACVANYLRFTGAQFEGGAWRCEFMDVVAKKEFTASARCVVNATGPWSQGLPNSSTSLRLTKGVHLVIDRQRLPVPDAVVLAEGERILFTIPWGERVILGTTDADYDGPIERPECDARDARYVLDVVNDAFPGAKLGDDDVLSTWAGLRPLVADRRGNPSDISRRHEIAMNYPGWWDVTGGKLTTYRLMAEETVDSMVRYVGVGARRCETAQLPLLAGVTLGPPGASGVLPPALSRDVVGHYCRDEWAQHLEDVMVRRTSWRHYRADHLQAAEKVAAWMGEELGWDDAQREAEVAAYRAEANRQIV